MTESSRSRSTSTTRSSTTSAAGSRGPASRTRSTAPAGSTGSPIDYLRELVEYWRDAYDWRAQEARLNELDHFRTEIDGQSIHFVHARSPHADALPLLITHGWPGSIVEFLDVIPRLTRTTFHVVAPSLPGLRVLGADPHDPAGTCGASPRRSSS